MTVSGPELLNSVSRKKWKKEGVLPTCIIMLPPNFDEHEEKLQVSTVSLLRVHKRKHRTKMEIEYELQKQEIRTVFFTV